MSAAHGGTGRRRGRGPEASAARAGSGVVLLLAGLLAAAGCTEDALVGPGPEGSEGAETIEVVLTPSEMALWRDTVFSGYALAADAEFLLAADGEDFRARPLLKYRTVPESVTVDSVRRAVGSYGPASLDLPVDTASSELPEGGATLRLRGLTRDWVGDEATWTLAREGTPWATPGGDLGPTLGELDLTGVTDSALADGLALPLDGATVDSLLDDWSRAQGGLGAALELEAGSGDARLRIRNARLDMEIRPAGLDTTVLVQITPVLAEDPSTFIHDPPPPETDGRLRIGGLPAHRIYFRFLPPDTVEDVPLRQATINRAELVFRPHPAPEAPFALGVVGRAALTELISDPFATGPRTPLSGGLNRRPIVPDSLAAGRPLRFGFTSLMSRWAAAPDSFGTFHMGVRMDPDAQDLGFWEFGGQDAPPELRPSVRLLLTPATTFDLP